MGLCRHDRWDQRLIYVEKAEICTFLEPVPDPALSWPEHPQGQSWSLGWEPSGLGWAGWTLPPGPWLLSEALLVYKGDLHKPIY